MAENVLGGLLGYSNALKRRIRGLLNDPVNFLESALYDVIPRPEEAAAVDPRNLSATPFDSPYVQKTLQLGGLLGPIVWHGSPYKFMKFDSSKIGSGEGAQAYGYGHYVAESPEVARTYSADRAYVGASMAGKPLPINYDDPAWIAQKAMDEFGDAAKAQAHLEMVQRTAAKFQPPETKAAVQGAIDLISARKVATKGNLYKIDLPDEAAAKMLDWDKPLSQQAPEVQKALAGRSAKLTDGMAIPGGGKLKIVPNEDFGTRFFIDYGGQQFRITEPEVRNLLGSGTEGKSLFADLVNQHGARKAEDWLRSHGIPGIRYLDQGSRGTGKGTYNYVVFPGNEDLLRILEINGQPVNALKGLLGQ